MGWVRGQTGEQKRKEKQSKDSPGLRGLGRRAAVARTCQDAGLGWERLVPKPDGGP